MATRKNTTKAKTKTAKKPASGSRAASAKSTRATKSTKASGKKPSVSKSTAVSSTQSASLTATTLRKVNFIKAFVFAALAVAAALLMNNLSYPVGVSYAAKDELVSLTAGNTVFVPGSQALLDVQVRWLVVIIMGLAALFSLLAATRLRGRYEAGVTTGVSASRWVGWGITSALMVEVVALLSGVSDIFVLKVIAGLMLVTCALAWIAEKRNKQAGRPVWSEFMVSLATGSLPWLIIFGYAVSTWIWGLIRYPWFVYALYAALLIGFTMLTTIQYKRIGGWKNTLIIERNYLLTGLATKAAFAVILILGFQK